MKIQDFNQPKPVEELENKKQYVSIRIKNLNKSIQDLTLSAPISWNFGQLMYIIHQNHAQLKNYKQHSLKFMIAGSYVDEESRISEYLKQSQIEQLTLFLKVDINASEKAAQIYQTKLNLNQQYSVDQLWENYLDNLIPFAYSQDEAVEEHSIQKQKLELEVLSSAFPLLHPLTESILSETTSNTNSTEAQRNQPNLQNQLDQELAEENFYARNIPIMFAIYYFVISKFEGGIYISLLIILMTYFFIKYQDHKHKNQQNRQNRQRQENIAPAPPATETLPNQPIQQLNNNNQNNNSNNTNNNNNNINNNSNDSSNVVEQANNNTDLKDQKVDSKQVELNLNDNKMQNSKTSDQLNKEDISKEQKENINIINDNPKEINIISEENKSTNNLSADSTSQNLNQTTSNTDLKLKTKKKTNSVILFFLRVKEFVYCFVMSLFPLWYIELYNRNHPHPDAQLENGDQQEEVPNNASLQKEEQRPQLNNNEQNNVLNQQNLQNQNNGLGNNNEAQIKEEDEQKRGLLDKLESYLENKIKEYEKEEIQLRQQLNQMTIQQNNEEVEMQQILAQNQPQNVIAEEQKEQEKNPIDKKND